MINVICDGCGKEKTDAGEQWFKVYNGNATREYGHTLDVTVDRLGDACAGSAMVACSPKCCGKLAPAVITAAIRHHAAMEKKDQDKRTAKDKEAADYEASVKEKMLEIEARKRLRNK